MTNQPSPFKESVDDQSITTPTQVTEPSGVVAPQSPVFPVTKIDPEHPPWAQPAWLGAIMAFFFWFLSVLCLVFVPLILVVPYVIYRMTTGSTQGVLTNLEGDKLFLFLSVLGVIPAHFLTFLLAYVLVTGGRKYPLAKTLGFSWPPSWSPIIGVVICVLIGMMLFGGGALITQIFPGEKTQLDLLIESSYGARVVTALLAVGTAPLVEEMVYRGILYPAIAGGCEALIALFGTPKQSRIIGAGVAIAVVSLFFAAVHVLQYQNNLGVIAVITLVSITLTSVRAYSGRLLPCFLIHLVFNGIQAIIILLYPLLPKAEPTPQPAPAELLALLVQFLS